MIKNYKIFKESLLNKLEGPSEEEVWNNLKEMPPNKLLYKSIQLEYYKGVKYALDNGATTSGITSIETKTKLLRIIFNTGDKETLYKLIETLSNREDVYYYAFSCAFGYLKGVQNMIPKIKKNSFNKDNKFAGLELAIKNNNIDIVIYLIEQFDYTEQAYEWESRAKIYADKYNNEGVKDYFLYRGY